MSRSFCKVKLRVCAITLDPVEIDRDLIFIMHVYYLKLHAFSITWQRSRSFFKVKGQISIAFEPIEIETWYLVCLTISRSRTFWGLTYQCQVHPSMSKVKFRSSRDKHLIFIRQLYYLKLHILNMACQGQRSNIHNCWTNRDRDLIFGMHDYLMKPHIFG